MPLTWDDTYDIAVLLMRYHEGVDPSTISLPTLQEWTKDLPGFSEKPAAAAERKLETIRTTWLALAQSGGAAGPPAM